MTAEIRHTLTVTQGMAVAMGCKLPYSIDIDSKTPINPEDHRVKRVVAVLAEVEWTSMAYKETYLASGETSPAVSASFQKWCRACAAASQLQLEIDIFIKHQQQ